MLEYTSWVWWLNAISLDKFAAIWGIILHVRNAARKKPSTRLSMRSDRNLIRQILQFVFTLAVPWSPFRLRYFQTHSERPKWLWRVMSMTFLLSRENGSLPIEPDISWSQRMFAVAGVTLETANEWWDYMCSLDQKKALLQANQYSRGQRGKLEKSLLQNEIESQVSSSCPYAVIDNFPGDPIFTETALWAVVNKRSFHPATSPLPVERGHSACLNHWSVRCMVSHILSLWACQSKSLSLRHE